MGTVMPTSQGCCEDWCNWTLLTVTGEGSVCVPGGCARALGTLGLGREWPFLGVMGNSLHMLNLCIFI